MRKKYDYFVNDVKVPKKEFFATLRSKCQKVIHTEIVAGWCGVDLMGFDEERYKRSVRDISKGVIVMFPSEKTCTCFKRGEA